MDRFDPDHWPLKARTRRRAWLLRYRADVEWEFKVVLFTAVTVQEFVVVSDEGEVTAQQRATLSLRQYRFRLRAIRAARLSITLACLLLGALVAGHRHTAAPLVSLSVILAVTWLLAPWLGVRTQRAAQVPVDYGGNLLQLMWGNSGNALSLAYVAAIVAILPWWWLPALVLGAAWAVPHRAKSGAIRAHGLRPLNHLPDAASDLIRLHVPKATLFTVPDRSVHFLGAAAGWAPRRIYLAESLLGGDQEFLLPVLAHEVAHHLRGDPQRTSQLVVARMTALGIGGMGMLFVFGRVSEYGVAPAFAALLGFAVAAAVTYPIWLGLSRAREWAAWVQAVRLLNDGEAIARRQEADMLRSKIELRPLRLF